MGTLSSNSDNRCVSVKDGDSLMEAAEDLNVTFRCRGGGCGACKTKVVEGAENLNPLTRNEIRYDQMHGLADDERLMCQATLRSGDVVIEPQEPEYDALGRLRLPCIPECPEMEPRQIAQPAA